MVSTVPASADSANADIPFYTSVTLDTATTTLAGRIGQQVVINVTGTTPSVVTGSLVNSLATLSIATALTAQPTGSSIYPTIRAATSAIGTGLTEAKGGNTLASAATNAVTITDVGTSSHVAVMNYVADEETDAVTAVTADDLGSVIFTPSHAGTYTL